MGPVTVRVYSGVVQVSRTTARGYFGFCLREKNVRWIQASFSVSFSPRELFFLDKILDDVTEGC